MSEYELPLKAGETNRDIGLGLKLKPEQEPEGEIIIIENPEVPCEPCKVIFTPDGTIDGSQAPNDVYSRTLTGPTDPRTFVTITTDPPGGLVRLTTDGSDPSGASQNSRMYNTAKEAPQVVTLRRATTLRAVSIDPCGTGPEKKALYPYTLPKGGVEIQRETRFPASPQPPLFGGIRFYDAAPAPPFPSNPGHNYYWGDEAKFFPDADYTNLIGFVDFTGLDVWYYGFGASATIPVPATQGNSIPYVYPFVSPGTAIGFPTLPDTSPTNVNMLAGTTNFQNYPWVTNPNGANTVVCTGVIDNPLPFLMPYMEDTYSQDVFMWHPANYNITHNDGIPPGAVSKFSTVTPYNPAVGSPSPADPPTISYPGSVGDYTTAKAPVPMGQYLLKPANAIGFYANNLNFGAYPAHAFANPPLWGALGARTLKTGWLSSPYQVNDPSSAGNFSTGPAVQTAPNSNSFVQANNQVLLWPFWNGPFGLLGAPGGLGTFATFLRLWGRDGSASVSHSMPYTRTAGQYHPYIITVVIQNQPADSFHPYDHYTAVARSWNISAGMRRYDANSSGPSADGTFLSVGFDLYKGKNPPLSMNAISRHYFYEHISSSFHSSGGSPGLATASIALAAGEDWFTLVFWMDLSLMPLVVGNFTPGFEMDLTMT